MDRRSIAVVGTGAVGQAIGRLLYLHGQPIVAVAGRTPAKAEHAAAFMGPRVGAVPLVEVPHCAERVLVATSDTGINAVAETLASAGFVGVALHTCGARGPEALMTLQRTGSACGVLHPLQTIVSPAQGVEDLNGISFGLAGDPEALDWGRDIIALLNGREISVAPGRMALYHAGAVIASNGMVALIDAAVRLMEEAGVESQSALDGLGPLSRATLNNVLASGPRAALTGPIARGDAETVRLHMDALPDAPKDIGALYRSLGRSLLGLARRRGLPESSLRAIAAALEMEHAGDAND